MRAWAGSAMIDFLVIEACWLSLAALSGAGAHLTRIAVCCGVCVAVREVATRGWRRMLPGPSSS
jgi:hypothetical protein